METSKEILTELQEIAPFLGRSGIFRVPYAIPLGYFEDFAEILMNRIRFEMVGFGDQAGSFRAKTEISSSEEIAEISPLLAGLQKKDTYQIPERYFESLHTKIPASETNPSKLVAIPGS